MKIITNNDNYKDKKLNVHTCYNNDYLGGEMCLIVIQNI